MKEIDLLEVPDSECMGRHVEDLEEMVLEKPSKERPFVFLWDEKTGGTTFNDWLLASASELGKLTSTHISDFGWPNVIGTPFFLKTYETSKLESLEILSATVDWNIFSALGCKAKLGGGNSKIFYFHPQKLGEDLNPFWRCAYFSKGLLVHPPTRKRQPSCFVLLRNPIDRFLSYYLERSDRTLEGGNLPLRMLTELPLETFEKYLQAITVEHLRLDGRESGIFCNMENAELCLEADGLTGEGGPETFGFRSREPRVFGCCAVWFQGPLNLDALVGWNLKMLLFSSFRSSMNINELVPYFSQRIFREILLQTKTQNSLFNLWAQSKEPMSQ